MQGLQDLRTFLMLNSSFLVNINRCTLGKRNAIGLVEVTQTHLTHSDMEHDGHEGTQQFTMATWIECWFLQLVVTTDEIVVFV